jgi:hypothetical protein
MNYEYMHGCGRGQLCHITRSYSVFDLERLKKSTKLYRCGVRL